MIARRRGAYAGWLAALATLSAAACLDGDARYADGSGGGAASGATGSGPSTSTAGPGPTTTSSGDAGPSSASTITGDDGGGGDGGASSTSTGEAGGSGGAGEAASTASASSTGSGGAGGGPLVHTLSFGNDSAFEVHDVRFGADGAINVAGSFRGAASAFGTTVLGDCHGDKRGFLLRLDADLTPAWVRCFGADSSEIVGAVFDGAGHAFVLGRFMGDLMVAGESFSRDVMTLFTASLDDQGVDRWAKEYPADAPTRADGIARTPDALYVSGSFRGPFVLGDQTLTAAGEYDAFLARLDADDGSVDWALHQDEGATAVSLYVGASPAGASPLLVAGEFLGALALIDPSGTVRTVTDADGPALRDVFVAEVDEANGTIVGPIKRIGGAGEEHVTGLDVGDDVAVVGGTFHDALDPDGAGGLLTGCTATDGDAFLVRLDVEDQRPLSILCVGGDGDQVPRSVATSRDGLTSSMGGDFDVEVDWGTGAATASVEGSTDGFLVETDEGLAVSFGEALAGSVGERSVQAVDAQSGGRLVASGTFHDEIVLPDGVHVSRGGADAFVVLYDALP